MSNVKVTLSEPEGHRGRSKITKNEQMVKYRKLLHSQIIYLVPRNNNYNDQHQIDKNFLDLDTWSRSHVQVKVEGHRCRGFCIL